MLTALEGPWHTPGMATGNATFELDARPPPPVFDPRPVVNLPSLDTDSSVANPEEEHRFASWENNLLELTTTRGISRLQTVRGRLRKEALETPTPRPRLMELNFNSPPPARRKLFTQ